MLKKYEFITIMEGEFCKIIIYKICVSNESFIFMKQNKNQNSEACTIFCHFARLWVNVMDVITQYWMYFVG